ncbi:MAG: type II toxin-antitoxin system HicB family antitoxin [Chloroflexi bacterium]|jgi:predicted RNase H-like HicB family nuclease|nr:type II toxin-antitoxin system HicB family antitoxin [Chloroflexota bacterium]
MQREFTSVIEKRGSWYIGYVEELPGVNTQGKTLRKVRENLKEALCLIIEANRELATKSQINALPRDSSLRSE